MKSRLNKELSQILILVLLLFPGFVLADIAVLIHGYHSSGNSWRYNGIIHVLTNNGWNDAGHYTPGHGNIGFPGYTLSNSGKHVVTVELPSESPMEVQADLLGLYLNEMSKKFPQQKIHLVGHSAGGVVARLALVRNYSNLNNESDNFIPIVQLITIASPHRGSPVAEIVKKASNSPVGLVAPLIGLDEINRAERLYKQMSREKENHFLFWLNRQPHPPIRYTSIVRANSSLFGGDYLVPSYSQDMTYVPAIGNQSQLLLTPGDHNLKYADGFLLMTLLP